MLTSVLDRDKENKTFLHTKAQTNCFHTAGEIFQTSFQLNRSILGHVNKESDRSLGRVKVVASTVASLGAGIWIGRKEVIFTHINIMEY
jgi:hypothetical protein